MSSRSMVWKGLVLTLLTEVCLATFDRCLPGAPCFPANIEIIKFMETLDGKVHYPNTADYDALVVQREYIYTKFPFAIVVVKNTADVQKCILFARKWNLLLSIKTSGHDFLGRSTAHGSLMIYLGNMTDTQVNLSSTRNPAGEITCESGNTWIKVYKEVDKYKRVIIGGSAHTVSMAGYTLGGGHSPMSRMFGMAVDNLLELEFVAADGSIVVADNYMTQITYPNGSRTTTDNTDIFWASKGGGGGTFGVATKFTYKLHYPAPQVVEFVCNYPIIRSDGQNIGLPVFQKIFSLLQNLPKEWGGYLIASGGPQPNAKYWGSILLVLNHYGNFVSATRRYMDSLFFYHKEWQTACFYVNRTTFLDYEITLKDGEYYSGYIMNTLLQNDSFTDDLARFLLQELEHERTNVSSFSFTGTLLGGEMMKTGVHDTSVHPGFRSALMSLSATISWENIMDYSAFTERGAVVGEQLSGFGDGQYPNEAGMDVVHWHQEFWGSNYKRLLAIKHKWDPDNYFTCRECVGSDTSNGATSSHGGSNGQPFVPAIG